MFSWRRIGFALLVGCCLATAPAQAAFPGENGKVAFERVDPSGACEGSEIWLANADGTARTRFTCGGRPAWSADGSRLAFEQNLPFPQTVQIFVINADGSGRRQVTFGDFPAYHPAWTPDGRIGYAGYTARGENAIYTIRPDGTDRRLVLSEPLPPPDRGAAPTEPKWSPDGTRIVFTYVRSIQNRDLAPAYEIHTVKADGTDRRRLTRTEHKPHGAPGNAYNPEWSPDGSRIAFTAETREGYEVKTMDPSGGSVRSLGLGEGPAWSPDGTQIVFLDQRRAALFLVRPDGSNRRQFSEATETVFDDMHPDWQPLAARGGNRPPDCSGTKATPNQLWPPNHKFHLVTVGGAVDPDGDTVTLTITGVQQDEPLNAKGKGSSNADAARASSPSQVWLRATRSGRGDGRLYRVAYTASDARGGTCSGTVGVGVPHDGRRTPVDSGPSFNSFG